jgi:hypothetical protein
MGNALIEVSGWICVFIKLPTAEQYTQVDPLAGK